MRQNWLFCAARPWRPCQRHAAHTWQDERASWRTMRSVTVTVRLDGTADGPDGRHVRGTAAAAHHALSR